MLFTLNVRKIINVKDNKELFCIRLDFIQNFNYKLSIIRFNWYIFFLGI